MADRYDDYTREELIRLLRERDRKPKFGLVWERDEIEHERVMQAIRQIYDNAPDIILVPEAFRHRRLEVLLIVEEETVSPPSLKSLLADMPDVGDDSDFSRPRDFGRQDTGNPLNALTQY